MKDMQVHEVGDLREGGKREEEMEEVSKERSRDSNDPLEVDIADEDSIFYGDFPSLPDFTCISSSSSSSSSPALPTRSTSSSSASSAWAVLKAEHEEAGDMMEDYNGDGSLEPPDGVPPPPADGMDVLEEIADMGILDDTDIWDPAALFPEEEENNYGDGQQLEEGNPNRYHQDQVLVPEEEREAQRQEKPSEDLAMVFFEWLKTNKESISPEDLRSIRLKRSTIECAARRLGGGKEGMKQLLILILAWVRNHHLQKRRNREEEMNGFQYQNQSQPQTFPVQVPVSISNGNPPVDSCFSPSWIHPTPYLIDPARTPAAPGFPPMMGYMGAATPAGNFPPSSEYHMIDPNIGWSTQFSQYGTAYGTDPPPPPPHQTYVGFANNYGPGQMFPSERLAKIASSATKEARKKRMARQRRLFTHHHHHHHHHHNRHQNHHASRLAGDTTCTSTGPAGQSNWVLYPPSSAPTAFAQSMISPDGTALPHADATAMQQRQIASDRRQGWKSEKNLRFLLQKVLKQSDVGNLGRIVLPKKEAETHLPELDARDGIAIQMEDIGTSRVWNMRYRYWPNNKSRMYLLENTGDFVRSNGLQEGDFIVIYSDAKCSKYMIRGVKVRKPELKQEIKGPVKAAKTPNSTAEGISPTLSKPVDGIRSPRSLPE